MIPEGICLNKHECNLNIYIFNEGETKCGLCKNINSNDAIYKLINVQGCLNEIPNNAEYYNENQKLLKCKTNYHLENNQCLPVLCYERCETSSEVSANINSQKCLSCKNGYILDDNNNCLNLPTTIPNIITTNIPTTIPISIPRIPTFTIPIIPTTISMVQTTIPLIQTSIPLISTTNPIIETTVSIIETTIPIIETTIPIIETTIPIIQTTIPIIETTIPIISSTNPIIKTTVSIIQTTIPIIETTIPIIQTTIPIIQTTIPIIQTTIPIIETTIPIIKMDIEHQYIMINEKIYFNISLDENIISDDQVNYKLKLNNIYTTFTSTKYYQNNKNENRTIIDLRNCEYKLKDAYNISYNKTLFVVALEITQEGMKIPIIEYEVYYKTDENKLINLNLTYCKNEKIEISTPISINSSIDVYNPKSGYYNDLCYIVTTSSGTDI